MIDEAKAILGGLGKVVLVHCGDPRIRGNLRRAIEDILGYPGDRMYRQLYPGVSRAIVDDVRGEVNLCNIGDYFGLGAEGVVLAHHGTTCHAYGGAQERQLHDLRLAGALIRNRFDCPVVGLWQEDPGAPQIEVVHIWHM